MTRTFDFGGSIVVTSEVSGQTVIGQVSGQTIISQISGQTIISSISGQSVITSVSGNTIRFASQQQGAAFSGGNWVTIVGTTGAAPASTLGLNIDTNIVAVNALTTFSPVIGLESATNQYVRVRTTESGSPSAGGGVDYRLKVSLWSGDFQAMSGKTVYSQGSTVRTGTLLVVPELSGGVELGSGVVFSAAIKSLSGNTDIFIGGTGTEAPFSGKGFLLDGGAAVTLNVNNFNAVRAFATTSGQKVSLIGVAP